MPESNTNPVNKNASFVINNVCFDVISIIHAKSKALKAYEKYFSDISSDTQLRQLLIDIRHDDQRHIARLKNHLGRLLQDSSQNSQTQDSGTFGGGAAFPAQQSASQSDFSPGNSI